MAVPATCSSWLSSSSEAANSTDQNFKLAPFVRPIIVDVVSREKINLDKVLRSLNVTCPRCGASLAPIERQRLDDDRVGCLKCGKEFQHEAGV